MGDVVVFCVFFAVLLFLFPVFVYVDAALDFKENRCWFSVSLYRRAKVFGGYAQLLREGIAFHLSKKKAVLVAYDKMTDTRKKFEITKGFQLWRYHQTVETGGARSPYGVLVAAALQSTGGAVCSMLQTRHPFLSLNSGVLLTEQPALKLTVQTAAVFNGLVLLIALIKKCLEALINWIRKKRLTASLKRQPSN